MQPINIIFGQAALFSFCLFFIFKIMLLIIILRCAINWLKSVCLKAQRILSMA